MSNNLIKTKQITSISLTQNEYDSLNHINNILYMIDKGNGKWSLANSIPQKYSFDITGDSINNSFIITHNLKTRDIIVNIYDKTTNHQVITDIEMTSIDSITITFAVAPAIGEDYRIVIIG